MDNHPSDRQKCCFDVCKCCSSEKPIVPTHVKPEHPLDSLFAPMNAKMAALSEENSIGDMSTSKPLILHLKGDMPENDYNSCSKLMDALLHVITDAIIQQSNASQTPITNTINNVELWVEAFRHFPLPVITGPKEYHHLYSKENFTLDENKEVIEDMIDIKGIEGLADVIIQAAKEAGGHQLKELSKQEKDFKYFGIIFGYFQQHICIRLVKFVMHMKETDIAALCEGKTPTSLNCEYDNYHFFGNTRLILQVATEIQTPEKVLMDNFVEVTLGKQARLLMTFLQHQFPLLLAHWLDKLTAFIKSKDNQIPTSLREDKQEISTQPQSFFGIGPKSDKNLEELLAAAGSPNLTSPKKKQYQLCLKIVEDFWNAQSCDKRIVKFNYMDGTRTEKEMTDYGITCRLDLQNSFTDNTGKTFANYQLKCESDSFACVLIQIPPKERVDGFFMYELQTVKDAFKKSLDTQDPVTLTQDQNSPKISGLSLETGEEFPPTGIEFPNYI